MKIVLGSASKRRKSLLQEMGYEFDTMSAELDERAVRHENPKQLVALLANAKADALIPRLDNDTLLITSDLVAVFNGLIVEKPLSKEEAYETLLTYKDNPVQTVVAVAVTNLKTGKRFIDTDVATVWFRPFEKSDVADFIESGKVFDHAGSFAAEQEPFSKFITKLEGAIDSVAGLPKALTKKLIEEAQK